MKRASLICIVVLALFFSMQAVEKDDSLTVTLSEINVTAVKMTVSVNSEENAMTYLTANQLEQVGAVSIHGISDVVPNFFMPDYGSRITSTIYVRGIGARMDQPSVGLNVDNIPYLNKDAYDFDLADIASVEMLRGPQSTLYGRNTMAGVINISTLSPLRFQGWRLYAEGGTGTRIKASAGYYQKFGKNTGLSASIDYSHLGGYFINEYNGRKVDHENNFGGRIKFEWRPSTQLHLMNVASAGFLRQGGYPYEFIDSGKIEYNDTCFYRRFTFADGLTVSYRGDGFTMTSISSVQHINDNMTLDQDFLPVDYFTLTQKKQETSLTEEIVIKGMAMNDNYRWLSGAFGFYKHLRMEAPVTFKDVGIRELIENHRNDANPNYPIKWDSRMFTLNSDFTIPTYGFALYHQSDFIAGDWTFTGALRLDYEHASLDYHSYCDTGYDILHRLEDRLEPYSYVEILIDDTGVLKKDFITVLPKVAISYQLPSDYGNIYAKVSKGYKSGGFNTQMFSDVLQQRLMGIMGLGSRYDIDDIVSYRPEKSWNYELGAHLRLIPDKLRMEGALFYIDCRDQQLTTFPDGTTTGRIMTNAGKTRSFGGEISLAYTPDEKWEANASYGFTNAKFQKFFNGISDFSGKYLPYVPSSTLFLQGLYTVALNKQKKYRLIFDVNMRGAGPIYWNEENSIKQNFYALLGASITARLDTLELKVWGRNITDTRYYTFYFLSMGNEFLQRGIGSNFGLSVRWTI